MGERRRERETLRVLSFLVGSTCLLLALFCWFVAPGLIVKIGLIIILVLVAWDLFFFATTGRPVQYFKKK